MPFVRPHGAEQTTTEPSSHRTSRRHGWAPVGSPSARLADESRPLPTMLQISCAFLRRRTPGLVRLAEELGYTRAWIYDTPALQLDVWMTLALAADRTTRIGLAPGVLIPSNRHVLTTASESLTSSRSPRGVPPMRSAPASPAPRARTTSVAMGRRSRLRQRCPCVARRRSRRSRWCEGRHAARLAARSATPHGSTVLDRGERSER